MAYAAFILGAGFGCDAGPVVGPIRAESLEGPFEITCNYPLMRDLAAICYPDLTEPCVSIEQWFQASIDGGDGSPLRRLYDTLMMADYYLAGSLASASSESHPKNPYRDFFCRFQDADFVTFNYDAFVEAHLYCRGSWYPHDGFGVPLIVGARPGMSAIVPSGPSRSLVLHLHGSLCVYESPFAVSPADVRGVRWLVKKPETEFAFDPHSIARLFHPWRRPSSVFPMWIPLEQRVIAPVPEKATGRRGSFAASVRSRALEVLKTAERVIAVGYSFNAADQGSYDALLRDGVHNQPLFVVSPDSRRLVRQLGARYPHLRLQVVPQRFREWADGGFLLQETA